MFMVSRVSGNGKHLGFPTRHVFCRVYVVNVTWPDLSLFFVWSGCLTRQHQHPLSHLGNARVGIPSIGLGCTRNGRRNGSRLGSPKQHVAIRSTYGHADANTGMIWMKRSCGWRRCIGRDRRPTIVFHQPPSWFGRLGMQTIRLATRQTKSHVDVFFVLI